MSSKNLVNIYTFEYEVYNSKGHLVGNCPLYISIQELSKHYAIKELKRRFNDKYDSTKYALEYRMIRMEVVRETKEVKELKKRLESYEFNT